MLKARCPNDSEHKEFVTVAHVSEDWIVDDQGNFIQNLGSIEIVAGPCKGNTWTCRKCNAEAVVTDE